MRLVVALGGNALIPRAARGTIDEQRAAIAETCDVLGELCAAGHDVVVTHGNGPQIGRLMMKNEAVPSLPPVPLDVLVAESQAQIGYIVQQELLAALRKHGVPRDVVTVVTQVLVDPNDPAFARPSKPVGPYLDEAAADALRARGEPVGEAPGGGYRRLVASPEPRGIVEGDVIRALVEARTVPVAGGGGGIPVVRDGQGLRGVAAVVDKDLTAAALVRAVHADTLLILTDVEQVVRGFGTARAQPLGRLTVAEARAGVESGEFPRGSMGEKVLAAARAAESGARAVIASLKRARDAAAGTAGTEIVP
jgi:carbamate kinase